MPFPLYHPEDVIRIHESALEYAIRVQQAVAKQSEQGLSNLVAGAALMTLTHEATCLHRAIRDLCRTGWTFAAPIMLRAMLETMCSVVVIANSA